jgi:hypothetical protein
MSSSEETTPVGDQEPNASDAAPAERKPWVTPALERQDLRDAMAGVGAVFDLTTGSS